MKDIAHKSPDKYLRKGLKVPGAEFVDKKMGGLKRLISLKASSTMLTSECYQRAYRADGTLPKQQSKFSYGSDAPKVVELIKSGKLSFNPETDLRPDALIQGYPPGASGWYFAANDAAVDNTKVAQAQLAISGDYLDGYVIVEVPSSLAEPSALGANRPTALDLTLAPEGTLNPSRSEPVGRTDPQAPGQNPVREVLLPPLPMSSTKRRTLVIGSER